MEVLKKRSLVNLLDNSQKKLIAIIIVLLFLIGIVVYITFGISEDLVEIKSVEIKSDEWDTQEPGSWKITKSAEWTGLNKAQITMDLETLPKYIEESVKSYDVVFALDVSTSMAGDKFEALKVSLKKYLGEVLDNTDNRIAFVEYHTTASVLSDFTNNKDDLNKVIDNLELKCSGGIIDGVEQGWGYCTNYTDGLAKVTDVLEDYVPEEGRQLTVLFLTDGSANKDVGLITSKYDDLKKKFPDIVINGIQYEMGSSINYYLRLASDYQYDAYIDDIYDKFFVATYSDVLARYEKFDITDYISDYFYIESESNIKVNKGTVEFDEETQKVTWSVASDIFMSGTRAKLTIDVSGKEPYSGINGYYPTNIGEDISSKLVKEEETETKSNLTPILKNFYTVFYNSNIPLDCNINENTLETHFVYEMVNKRSDQLMCEGYLFKGWEFVDDVGINMISNDAFEMPEHDVELKAVWGTLDVSKNMEGIISSQANLYDIVSTGSVLDTNINFNSISSDSNGRGNYLFSESQNDKYPVYYYRGAVSNNNVIFANFCWKIVRTTETGGVKLIYNGKVGAGNICNNTGTSSQLSTIDSFNRVFNDAKYVGYMYDIDTSSTIKDIIDNWYEINILDKYDAFLEDTIWCNDRSIVSISGNTTYYGAYGRLISNITPSLECPQKADKYTVKETSSMYNASLNGNKLLDYPIALLTADEVAMAGGKINTNNLSYYLSSGFGYWIMSPWIWDLSYAHEFRVAAYGTLNSTNVNSTAGGGVRPSISLVYDTRVTTLGEGEPGTATNPYIVEYN